ncbi:MAG: hypothetical protein ACJ79S_18115 [Gemmatimonadaceae bacterium]
MKRTVLAVAAVALSVAGASTAHAQASLVRPVSFGVSAGAALPNGDISDGYDAGFHVTGLMAVKPALLPLSFRGELGYDAIAGKAASVNYGTGSFSGKTANMGMIVGSANVLYNFGMAASPVRPYVIGGAGVYNYKVGGSFSYTDPQTGQTVNMSATERQTKFGINGGLGMTFNLGAMSTFAEARFHNAFADGGSVRFIPITFGIMF